MKARFETGSLGDLARGPVPVGSNMLDFLFQPELSFLEGLDSRVIGQRAAQFFFELPFETGVLELQGADMRRFHRG